MSQSILPKRGKPFDPIRQKAKENGDIYYFTGRPCKYGHVAKRRTKTGSCQDCHHNSYKSKEGDYSLRSKYGITLNQYNEIYSKQNGKCLICNQIESAVDNNTKKPKNLAVDHCHNSRKVKGLLCQRCNQGIGLLKHNSELLRKAALYCEAVND